MMENIGKTEHTFIIYSKIVRNVWFWIYLGNYINTKVIGIYLGKYLPENPDVLLVSSSKIMRNK